MPSTILCVLPSLSCLIFTPLCVHYVTICVTSGKWKCSESAVKVCLSVMCSSLQPPGLGPTRLLCSWNSLGKNTGVGSHFLLQGIFLTQGSNPGHPHCRQILYHLGHQGQDATRDQWRNNSRKNEGMKPKQKQTQLWMWLLIEARSDAVKSKIA